MPMTDNDAEIEKLHEEACRQGDLTYRDPITGYAVMTRIAHLARGSCCTNGCRHCPYGTGGGSDAGGKDSEDAS